MVQQVRCILILLGAFFYAQSLNAQTTNAKYRELIVQVPGIGSQRGFPEIRGKLINIPGVHVIAFCESQHLILIRIDKKKLADNKPVLEAISHLEFKFYLKKDATIAKAMDACKDKSMTVFKYDDPSGE